MSSEDSISVEREILWVKVSTVTSKTLRQIISVFLEVRYSLIISEEEEDADPVVESAVKTLSLEVFQIFLVLMIQQL